MTKKISTGREEKREKEMEEKGKERKEGSMDSKTEKALAYVAKNTGKPQKCPFINKSISYLILANLSYKQSQHSKCFQEKCLIKGRCSSGHSPD